MAEVLDKVLAQSPAAPVWAYFAELSRRPRPSGGEEAVRVWLREVAAAHGWTVRQDAAGNLVLVVPGCGRLAGEPALVLQAHIDMIGERRGDVAHDFCRDPISWFREGDWVRAAGTTLGADDGIGLALALAAAAAPATARLPLELLCTSDEETGLTGARQLDPRIIQGRRLLNLDGESDGVFTIGCAGGLDLVVEFPVRATAPATGASRCRIRGLRGGHSGVNIHEGRANAILLAARLVEDLRPRAPDLQLHAFAGGTRKNAIPRDSEFTVSGCPRQEVDEAARRLLASWREREPGVAFTAEPTAAPPRVLPQALTAFLLTVPSGALAMDPDSPEVVMTSNSIGVAEDRATAVRLVMHARSSVAAALDAVGAQVQSVAAAVGATCAEQGRYHGWRPAPDSRLRETAVRCWAQLFGQPPRLERIHAGLEAGVLGERLGTTELLAAGPTVLDAHAPSERVQVLSVEHLYRFLLALTQGCC